MSGMMITQRNTQRNGQQNGYANGQVQQRVRPAVVRQPVIEISELTKSYQMGETAVHALRGVSLTIPRGGA